jgi:uncharacterized YkwD family protein
MRKLYSMFFSLIFVVSSLAACNTDNEQTAGEFNAGNVGNDKLTHSTISHKPSGHQTRKISFNNEQNEDHDGKRFFSQQRNTSQQAQPKGITGATKQGTQTGTSNNQAQTAQPAGNFIGEVVTLTNQARQKNGLGPISADNALQKAAQMKSEDMSKNNYFSHTSPTYGSPFQMLKDLGIEYRVAAENIAAGQKSPEEVVTGWMNSPGHRQNILNKDITHIGVGYAESGSYWTQLFIKK